MPDFYRYYAVRIDTEDVPKTLVQLEDKWNSLFPGYSFNFFFLDSDLERQYLGEQQLGKIFGAFAFIAILIACLGLFGLAAFTAHQRTKEIGIRKALGASISGVIFMLSKEFVALVVLAVVLASPLAYFFMTRWLESFSNRVEIGVGLFFIVGILSLLIAVATVSFQSIKAGVANPVDSLRSE